MTEDEFRQFHSKTAPGLRAYLARMSGNEAVADDIVQSAYVRFLRSGSRPPDFSAQRVYLFRIGVNLLRDEYRREYSHDRRVIGAIAAGTMHCRDAEEGGHTTGNVSGLSIETRLEVRRALDEVTPRDRELLWLAYVIGMTHREIAGVVGVGEGSVRVLLLRARRRLALVLHAHGVGPEDLR